MFYRSVDRNASKVTFLAAFSPTLGKTNKNQSFPPMLKLHLVLRE
jgi:hypothetical protein